MPIRKIIELVPWNGMDDLEHGDDEDPDVIQGIQPEWDADLGMTGRRDPDALPPSNAFQVVMHWIHDLVTSLGRGNTLFALKAGLLTGTYCHIPRKCFFADDRTVILCIPSFLRSTAHFAYGTFTRPSVIAQTDHLPIAERFVWGM